jgi:hypothetical protein
MPSDIVEQVRLARRHPTLDDLYAALVGWSAWQISLGNTQEGGDVLAFLLRQPLDPTTHERAEELWEELASRACPRVIYDARDFASKATLTDILDYIGV